MNFDDGGDCPFDNLGAPDTPPPTPPQSPPTDSHMRNTDPPPGPPPPPAALATHLMVMQANPFEDEEQPFAEDPFFAAPPEAPPAPFQPNPIPPPPQSGPFRQNSNLSPKGVGVVAAPVLLSHNPFGDVDDEDPFAEAAQEMPLETPPPSVAPAPAAPGAGGLGQSTGAVRYVAPPQPDHGIHHSAAAWQPANTPARSEPRLTLIAPPVPVEGSGLGSNRFTPNPNPNPHSRTSSSEAAVAPPTSSTFVPYRPAAASKTQSAAAPATPKLWERSGSGVGFSNPTRGKEARPRRAPAVAFGFGGVIAVGSAQRLIVTSIASACRSSQHVEQLGALPGPIESSAKPDQLACGLSLLPRSPLTGLLELFVSKPFDWHRDLPAVASMLQTPEGESPMRPTIVQLPLEHLPEALAQVQSFIVAGDREEALRCALYYKLYAQAMLIAMVISKEAYDGAVAAMLEDTLQPSAPLANAFRLFSGIRTDKTDLTTWQMQVKTVLANPMPTTADELQQWGDALSQPGDPESVEAAHFCYVVAQQRPAERQAAHPAQQNAVAGAAPSPDPPRFVLVGGVHRRDRCRSALLTPLNLFRTELLEHARQKLRPDYVRQSLLPFRLAMAMLAFEAGFVGKGVQYCEHVAKVLPSATLRAKGDNVPRTLPQLVADWKALAGGRRAEAGSAKWWPFGASGASAAAGRAMTPNPVPAKAAGNGSFGAPAQSSAAEKRSMSTRPDEKMSKTVGSAPAQRDREGDGEKGRKGWFSTWRKPKPKEDAVKVMQLDSDPVEVDESGNYKFERTEEELRVERQIKAGPPKMPLTSPNTPIGTPPPMTTSPVSGPPSFSHPAHAAPPVTATTPLMPPPPMAKPATPIAPTNRYVDMFNSA